MSVIIRLQNLPWSANALDIRSFFRGLAIPDGGVHIVGGEMGDAFIAFSTDEDARQAMMHDRGKISEVQIRLLLSSRAEMQKVIETARQQSLAMQLQLSTPATVVPQKPQPALTTPQPPVITSNSLHILSSQPLQTNAMGISFDSSRSYTSVSQQQSNNYPTGVIDPSRSSRENARDNRRSTSRDRRRSRSTDRGSGRRRRDRSRTRSRDRKFRRSSRRSRSRDRSHERSRDRSRDRSRERSNRDRDRNGGRSSRKNSKDFDNGFYTQDRGADRRNVLEKSMEKEVPKVSPGVNNAWEVMPTNAYTTSSYAANYAVQAYQSAASAGVVSSLIPQISVKASLNSPTGSDNREATKAVVSDNKAEVSSLSFLNATHLENRPTFAFQNPYTQANLNTNTSARDEKDESKNSFNAYNTVNQTDAFGRNLPKIDNSGNRYEPTNSARFEFSQKKDSNKKVLDEDQSCVKITNMCPSTSYSDIRRFFSGLYIPNNGIKMINDQHGLRMGTAYIRFVRAVNVPKALVRDGTQFKSKKISLVAVSDAEFDSMVDSFKPLRNSRFQNNDNVQNGSPRYGNINRDDEPVREAKTVATSPEKQFSILLVKEIAPHSTQQDVMKMFSSYTILDILMTHRGVNRRDIIAYVKFHRSEEARTAYDDISNHRINQRPVRVVISTEEEFEQAQEKVRIAAEKQMKEQLHLEEIEKRKQAEAEAEAEAAAEAAAVATAAAAAAREEQDDQIHHDDQDDRDNQNEEEEPGENDGMGSDSPQYAIAEQDTDFDQRDENIDVFNNERREFPKPSQQSQLKPSNPFSGIPSLLDIPATVIEPEKNTDPRLRHGRPSRFDNPDANIAAQQQATANKFVIVKNCEYRTTIQAIGEYFVKHCIIPNHIEMLRNHRNQPCGEFIIEFQNSESAAEAVLRNNDRLSIRPIRVSLITPQQIADRMNQPFMNCLPSGDNQQHYQQPNNNNMMMNNQGMRQNFNKMGGNFNNNRNNSGNDHSNDRNVFGPDQSRNQNQNSNFFRGGNNGNHSKGPRDANGPMNMPNNRNRSHIGNPHNPFSDANDQMEIESSPLDDDDDDDGMPEKFQRPGCVVEMENVPYRADLRDIIDFFDGYNILAEDIIRRYNDDGSPTGDARVAFNSETEAKAAYEAKRQKSIFNRTIFLNIL